jgi:hypothetical protein
MNKKKLLTFAVCFLVAAVCYVAIHTFSIETLALGWHALHGRTAHLKSSFGPHYDVDVPILTMAQLDDNGWSLFLFYRSMRLSASDHRPRWGSMTLSVSPAFSTAEETRKSAHILRELLGEITTEVAPIHVAGQDLYCFERTTEHSRLPGYVGDGVTVNCLPLTDKRGFSTTYMGSRALLPEFYSVLSSVKRVN